ncbi:hypothetical protein [Trinickia soli]|uniref:Transferrin-binding protein B C-lobe/N-lobe beta barrel domain-containing protein n=1 Tax=Trinickia soli TaxID=380675 RepID=A0A2N7W9L2_9BURK|nr:hypothetical protein [Trinickia soli]PMS26096.1 hypothetical protein C0Z19_07565 [Trinickia soli]CAB3681000.1 hypothetical protein LMG24076_02431 [Trinickia soli]
MSTPKYQAIAAAILTLTLAACGGGGGGSGTSTQTSTNGQGTSTQAGTDYVAVGSAPTVTGVNGSVSVLFSANALRSNGMTGTSFSAPSVSLSTFTQQAAYGGAFTTVNSGVANGAVTLTKGGTIADINGAGGYVAIGRWTQGSDSSGGNYTANQGGTYVVGNPLTLTATSGTLSCSALMSTSPTAVTGSVAPGKLSAATATLDLSTMKLSNLSATVTIGSDVNATIAQSSVTAKGMQFSNGFTAMAEPMGNDASKPLIALAYGTKLTNTGDINGVIVFACQ